MILEDLSLLQKMANLALAEHIVWWKSRSASQTRVTRSLTSVQLSDMGQVLEAMMEVDMAYKGVDAVVHLAAIPCQSSSRSPALAY